MQRVSAFCFTLSAILLAVPDESGEKRGRGRPRKRALEDGEAPPAKKAPKVQEPLLFYSLPPSFSGARQSVCRVLRC